MHLPIVLKNLPRVITCLLVVAAAVAVGAAPATKAARAAKRAGKISAQPARLPAAVLEEPAGTVMEVAAIDRARRPAVETAAQQIDGLLEKHWNEHGVEGSDPLTDAQFVRRIYLELAGQIPTFDETMRFLDSRSSSKRADLINELLESPGYVSHTYNFWADILRLSERPQKDLFFEP